MCTQGCATPCGAALCEQLLGHFKGTEMSPKRETFVKFWLFPETCVSAEREARSIWRVPGKEREREQKQENGAGHAVFAVQASVHASAKCLQQYESTCEDSVRLRRVNTVTNESRALVELGDCLVLSCLAVSRRVVSCLVS